MAETITEKLTALNQVDLTGLANRIAALKAEYEKSLAAKGKNANTTATTTDIKTAANQAGISVDEFMKLLEESKRRGLI